MNNNKYELLDYLKKIYNIPFASINKVKGTYKLEDVDGKKYGLKVVKYKFKHFNFIMHAMLHLQDNNFDNVLKIITTKYGDLYIRFNTYFAYLTNWIDSVAANFENDDELANVILTVANMHIKSRAFMIDEAMEPRMGWFSWIDVFNARKNEILDFRNRIHQKAVKSSFDRFYLQNLDYQIELSEKSIQGIMKSKYFKVMENHVKRLEFCHHDLANHNLLIDCNKKVHVIDFDYCILDSHIHDLSSVIIRTMKNGNWDNERCKRIIKTYSSVYKVYDEELEIMKYFIMFPQEFWQIGLQKYWEQQPYDEDRYINRIRKYVDDEKQKSLFLNHFYM